MRNTHTLGRLDAVALRTLEYRDSRHGADALRQIADAAARDPWGRVVQVQVSTDRADAPADCAEG